MKKRVVVVNNKEKKKKYLKKDDEYRLVSKCCNFLSRGYKSRDIAERFNARYKICEAKSFELIRFAKKLMEEMLSETLQEHRARSLGFYQTVLKSPWSTWTDKIRAQNRIDRILGLEMPILFRGEISDSTENISRIAKAVEKDPMLLRSFLYEEKDDSKGDELGKVLPISNPSPKNGK